MAKIKKTGRHTGAIKAGRQAARRRLHNIGKKEKIKGLLKETLAAVTAKNKDKAAESFRKYSAEIDKAIKTGLFHWRNSARKKSHLARLTNRLSVQSPAPAGQS
ncbi:MAG: 30S ribosomal protein S20 [Elusimicrobia bacterium]|nr:30S ribosomal protein S20 [Elusimicrobiota bacterium]